ncbi:MAG: 3-deoxy-manno-octulosonate cytidylyltransferase [Sedimentisphaerales bacterium]|nr:3-deoxy-manno-octulosonate cytidylyltransferase [Sedimentisphaerales bacterium]
MKIVVCIPARYGSSRFAAKVLAKDTGKYLVQHTYEQACQAKLPERVIIATDDELVAEACSEFGAECVMTSAEHKSGTDRIAEAIKDIDVDILVNLQGDEPEINPSNIDKVAQLLIDNPDAQMGTLAAKFQRPEQISNPNIVKCVLGADGRAIYFSRSVIPYDRQAEGVGDIKQYLRHLGIYSYRKEFLLKYPTMPQGRLEQIEKLEQLRAIENGYSIMVDVVGHTCDGIDTFEQYAEFVKRYKNRERITED